MGAWAEKLREAAFDAVKETDIQEIVAKQVELAKTGDPKALKFVSEFLLGGPPKIQMQKVVVIKKSKSTNRQAGPAPVLKARQDPSDERLDEECLVKAAEPAMISPPAVKVLRRLAARILKSEGPTQAPALAAQLEVEAEELETVMRCDWFKLTKGSWTLTPEGNASV